MKKHFDIPTKDDLKNFMKNRIVNASDNELEELYEEVTYNIKNCPAPSVVSEFKEEKEWIIEEMKRRNMQIPTFFNKLKSIFFK